MTHRYEGKKDAAFSRWMRGLIGADEQAELTEIVVVEPDRTLARVRMPATLPKIFTMSVKVVEAWIISLGVTRAKLKPAVPDRPEPGGCLAVLHPSFEVSTERLSGDVLLSVRDERYGWLTFAFDKAKAHDLGDRLQRGAATPARVSGTA